MNCRLGVNNVDKTMAEAKIRIGETDEVTEVVVRLEDQPRGRLIDGETEMEPE